MLAHKYGNVEVMKTTLEIPDDLFRRTKATAALRGESLKHFVTEALLTHLERKVDEIPEPRGWRRVFGLATQEEVAAVDARIAEAFEQIEPDEWR